jgi:type IV pilus assembly protein PilV
MRAPRPPSQRRRGFALLEVLIAVLVMAFGMLGIAQLLLVTTRSNASSGMRQQAIQSAYNMLDRIRANRQAALNGEYDTGALPTSGTASLPAEPDVKCDRAKSDSGDTCSAAQMAEYDLWYWLSADVSSHLPNGAGQVTSRKDGANVNVTVTVQWDDGLATEQARLGAAAASSATGNPSFARFVVQSVL